MTTSSPRVLFPAVALVYLGGGETTAGVLTAAVAGGAILAGVFSGGLARVRWQGRIIVLAITVWGIAVAAFGLVLVLAGRAHPDHVLGLSLALAVVSLAAAGAADAVSAVFRQTILQTATPDDMRGRLQGVFVVVVAGGPRRGELLLGAVSEHLGEGGAALAGGLACVVILWLLVRWQRGFWRYDARDPQP